MFLVQAFYAHGSASDDKWEKLSTHPTREEAQARIDEHRVSDECYLVELWEYAGCYHAIG